MKKRIAIISAAFMMAVGFQQAHAQHQVDLGQSTLSEMDVKEQSTTRVEQLDKEALLDLSSEQKNSLVTAMIEYSNAQISLQEEFQEDMSNMEMAFQKTINDILDTDQRDSLESYLNKINDKQEEEYRKQFEDAQKQWEKEMNKKVEEEK
jgi:hypothetical protein